MKLSIVIPVYNVERYLGECLDSLLGQSFSDWEAICVDDGSTDGSGRMLDEYARRDPRICVIHQPNAKVHAARNRALDVARGEWIGFLDPDDAIVSKWFEVAVAQMRGDTDFVHLKMSCRGAKVPKTFYKQPAGDVLVCRAAGADAYRWCWDNLPGDGFLWSYFIRADRIGSLRFRPGINCKEDLVFLLELAPRIKGVAEVDFKGYFYRIVEGSLSIRRHYVIQTSSFIHAYDEIWRDQREIARANQMDNQLRCILTRGVINDVTDWALRHKNDDPNPTADILSAYRLFEEHGGCDRSVRSPRLRYRLPFLIWRHSGWVWPMTVAGRTCLFFGNLLRGVKGWVRGKM